MKFAIDNVLANGIVVGNIFFTNNDISNDNVVSKDDEISKLKDAISASINQIEEMKKTNKELLEYLNVQQLMISDPNLISKATDLILNKNKSACEAVSDVLGVYISDLKNSTSLYLQERAIDIKDIIVRITNNLKTSNEINTDVKYILYTDILYPSFLIHNKNNIIGIIAKSGGYTSHSAILCRQWDIPYVISNEDYLNGEKAIIDTGKGIIITNPSCEEILKYENDIKENDVFSKISIAHDDYLFLANVGSNLDLKKVLKYKFDGVGLYRTEMIFMNTNRPYTFTEQYEIYQEAVNTMGDKYLCFRTFDIGDDKKLSYIQTFKKGIDNYRNNPQLFINQVKALLKANTNGNMRIMFPMIESVDEFRFLKDWVLKIREENNYNMPKIGMMLETKKALENITTFTDVDFISVGTNDLTSELYHMDRDKVLENPKEYINDLLEKLKNVVKFCEKFNICLSVCGELASVSDVAKTLYSIGIKNLSVSPSAIQNLNRAYTDFKKTKEK